MSSNVFDVVIDSKSRRAAEFNLRKMCRVLNGITEEQLQDFSSELQIPLEDVHKAFEYVSLIPPGNMRKKIQQTLEQLKHSTLVKSLTGGH